MPLRLEDYGLIGDTHTAALVGHDGSIDWLCVPRFDSGACFAALLGEPEHGRWLLAPAGDHRATRRRYRDDTLVLETEYTTHEGAVRVVDCMPVVGNRPDVLRRVEGLSGRVRVRSELVLRLDYGHIVPWIREVGRRASAFAGPDALTLDSDVDHRREGDDLVAEFSVSGGEHVESRLTWSTPRDQPPGHVDVGSGIRSTEQWWREWVGNCAYQGEYRDAVVRSLITLKAMSYGPRASSRRRRRPCPRSSAGCGTGTTGSAGSATPPSRCSPCWMPASRRRRWRGGTGCCAPWRAGRSRCS